MPSLDLDRFHTTAAGARAAFAAAEPFPHLVLDDFLHPEVAGAVAGEFALPSLEWGFYYHVNEQKLAVEDTTQMGPASRQLITDLQSGAFREALGTLTGIDGLLADPGLDGGGLQQMPPGSRLNLHTDFLAHTTRPTWSRQVNLLLYLNRGWDDAYQGWIELWSADARRCVRRIAPAFNRCLIFRTSAASFHGIPAPVACPEDDSRKSLALYYFRDEGRRQPLRPTNYVPLPDDRLGRRLLIRLDRDLLHAYSALKRYTPIGNRAATRVLRLLARARARPRRPAAGP